jgi:peptidoglycan/xylan/chitin deacetylase (PgdA/CDA1 family)
MRLPFLPMLFVAMLSSMSQAGERTVAVTIDDLPYQRGNSLAEIQTLTERLVNQLVAHKVPSAAFVNEAKLHDGGPEELTQRTALLRRWMDAGAELGNHTYSHMDINTTPLDAYKQDILRGHQITQQLMKERGMTLRYFRHPYLRTGKDPQTNAELARFLEQHGYTIAPVTIDNDEWIYASAYDKAAEAKDEVTMRRIASDYISYMEHCFAFSEHLATQVFGRDIKQVLLIHANALNADYLDELIAMIRKRGYDFISLPEALEDPAYRSKDTYVGPRGLSWLFRWSGGKQLDTAKAPQIPEYVTKLAELD